jgi:uncharacterized protein
MKPTRLSFLIAAAIAVSGGAAAHAQTVNIVTTPAGSFTNSIGAAVAKVVNEHAGVRAVVTPQQSPGLEDVDDGAADFGLSTLHDVQFFVTGRDIYAAKGPHKNIRVFATMTPLRAAVHVRKDSDIKTLADLKGKRITCDFAAQPTGNPVIAAFLAAGGLTRDDVTCVPTRNIPGAADDFAAGRSDAFYFAVGAAKVKEVSASVGGLRLLPFQIDEGKMASTRKILPSAFPFVEQPSPAVDEITEPTPVLAYDLVMFTHAKVSNDVVRRMAAAVHGNKDGMVAVFGGLRLFDPKAMGKPHEFVEYHPGVIDFYKEKGIWQAK